MHKQQVESLEIYNGIGNCFQRNRTVDTRNENPEHCALLEGDGVYLLCKEISVFRAVGLTLFTISAGMNVK